MKGKILLVSVLIIVLGCSSCFISSHTDAEVLNKKEYASDVRVKTVKVPLWLVKPFARQYFHYSEEIPTEVNALIKKLKKVKATIATTNNENLMRDFRASLKDEPGNEWISVRQNKRWVTVKAEQDGDDVIKRMLVAVAAPEEGQLIFVKIKCKLTPDEMSTLINFALNGE